MIAVPYRYLVATADNRMLDGVLDAGGEEEAAAALAGVGYTVLSLRWVAERPRLDRLFPTLFGVKAKDVVVLSRQLAILLKAGTPLTQALRLLQEQAPRASLRDVLGRVAHGVEQGNTLSHSLESEGRAFPALFVRLVHMGERSGNLVEVLRQAAAYMESEQRTGKKITGALIYPAIVMTLATGVVILMVTVVLPPLAGVFQSLKVELPLPTRIVLALSQFVAQHSLHLVLAAGLLGAAAALGSRSRAGRRRAHALLLRLPVAGQLIVQRSVGRSARMASLLLQAGVPVQEMLSMLAEASGNIVIREALLKARLAVLGGGRLGAGLANSPLATPLFLQMVRVGEETGALSQTLDSAATFYEQAVEERLAGLVTMLEPALTVGVGAVVGLLALSVVMPMVSLTAAIQ